MSDHGRLRILATAPLRGEGIDTLEHLGTLIADPWITGPDAPLRIYGEEQLAARIIETGADVIICEADTCRGPVLDLPLRAICSTRGDPTNVDVAGATAKGIPVLHAPGRNADAVAELTVALLLAVTRHLLPADRDVREGQVFRDGTIPYQRFRAWQLAGRTAGIVGLGAVGRAARWRFEGLGMRVISFDPYREEATHRSLEELLAEADVVSIHAAPTPETLGMMSAERFARMKPGAVYLNTARAGLHDLAALTSALESGHLAGAGLDHFEGEVLPTDHPLVDMANVVLTPHIGGATYDTEANHTRMIADDLARLVAGQRPLHCANPEVLP
ncbi:NAD(P)-dependent oxidoreductase [Rhabdothermincola sediminis]|uniref:NAD(P)-dependent oxidoreductase n=1 Tax=Rhabdothermincola sediminis TaxID=2751370 RepID=UPI0027DAA4BC|nr:NAD(P)-dependent oxidoreductase [Rhabdothermincola sediminis]